MTARIIKHACKLMGNHFELSVVADDEIWANEVIQKGVAEIQRIESLLTTFNDNSETNRINANAGVTPVTVSRETFELIARSLRISSLTQGAFDISYGGVDKRLWNFDKTMTALPDAETAKRMVHLVNYRNIILDPAQNTVFLKEKGMRIGFGGIGKGYAAERARHIMQGAGSKSGIVNASGDLATWGHQPDGRQWTIAIADPEQKGTVFSYLNISNLAVATSGNYEKFIMIGSERYSHTINPRTGLPVKGIKSVTIITTNAEIADAMATPVTIMGVTAGLNLINQMKDIEAIIIDDNDRLFVSDNIRIK